MTSGAASILLADIWKFTKPKNHNLPVMVDVGVLHEEVAALL